MVMNRCQLVAEESMRGRDSLFVLVLCEANRIMLEAASGLGEVNFGEYTRHRESRNRMEGP